MLDPAQLAALREALCADLAHHAEWADLWNLHGLLEAWEGRPREACDSFHRALKRNPGYGTARWNWRWIDRLAAGGDGVTVAVPPTPTHGGSPPEQPDELLSTVRNLVAGVPSDVDESSESPAVRFFGLVLAAESGDRSRIENALRRLREAVPISSELLATAGFTHADGSLRLPRLAEIARPERLNPDYRELFHRAGHQEEVRGREDEARRLFALAALFSGEPAAFHVDLGEMASRRGDTEEALRFLRRAAEESPDWELPSLLLGYEHSVRNEPAEALPCLERAAELRPRWPDVLYQLGLVQHALGRNEEAVRTFERAVGINPGYLVARIALANLLFEAKRGGEAAPHYERILDEGMSTPTLVGRFGYSLHAAGARIRAEEIFLEALGREPGRPEILALYGLFLAETDRRLEARAVWDRAMQSDPSPETRERIEEMRIDISVEE
jgi:tetratricopeptide (TPR) repeat protein